MNPAITHKIESIDAPYAVQQFLKDLLGVETNSEGVKSETYGAIIDEYVKNQEIEKWMQESGV